MVSVAELQAYLNVTGNDALLATIEAGVVSFLEQATNRLWTSPAAERAEIQDAPSAQSVGLLGFSSGAELPKLRLDEEPTGGALTSVEYRDSPTDAWAVQTLADFELDGRDVFVLDGSLPVGQRNVRMKYPFGWAEDAGPADVTLLILQFVKFFYDRRGSGLIKSAGIGPMRITYVDVEKAGLSLQIEALRRPEVAV